VSLSTAGSLTIPGDIRCEGNINIEINLSDSTLRRWQFGEDGALTFPDGTNQSTAWTGSTTVSSLVNGANTLSLGSTGTLTLPNGGVIEDSPSYIKLTPAGGANEYQALLIYPTAGDGNHIHLAAPYGGGTELYLGNDLHYVKLATSGNVEVLANDGFNIAGWIFGTDGALTIPGDIKSNSNINIDINLTDSTLRRWQFGEDGNLTLPPGGTILNSSGQPYVNGVTSISSSVSTGIYTDASGDYQYGTLSYDYAVNGVTSGGFSIEYSRPLVGGNVDIHVGNAVVNGDLTLSGDIKSEGNINIDINLADSTLRRWQFGEDGQLTFPDGGNLRVSGIPASSIGLAGDTAGMLAFNASYAYYCTASYDGVTNIWRRTAHDVATW
jgi:hypothetical protein